MQTGENIGQNMDRVCGSTTEEAGMQIAIGSGDDDFLTDQAAQRCGNRRRLVIPHACVADQSVIGFQLTRVGVQEGLERRRTGFLFTFEENGDADRQRTADLLIDPARLDEGHQLPLVIRRSTARNHLSTLTDIFQLGIEGIVLPQIDRIDRLDVVVAVKQHMRRVGGCAIMMRDHHGVTGGITDRRVETDARQIAHQPLGGLAAFRLIGWIGGDGLDADEFKKSLKAGGKIVVNRRENGGNICHCMILSCLACHVWSASHHFTEQGGFHLFKSPQRRDDDHYGHRANAPDGRTIEQI